jgi:hypothetical protein
MFSLQKGDCEHCARSYHYALFNATFGDYSYAYCDSCGYLATFGYSSAMMLTMPKLSTTNQVIDASWEPYIRPCLCGGKFRRGASPRCLYCHEPLSATHAAKHIERNTVGAPRGWQWQGNWKDSYCLAMEDPQNPGNLRQAMNPFRSQVEEEKQQKSGWRRFFGSNK